MNGEARRADRPAQYVARLPTDLHAWLREQADRNGSSINSELIRSVRERHDRLSSTAATD